jgi:RNA polymerase sigma factor (sigma-70 family)
MEASALQPTASLAPARVAIGAPWLRLRSDEQLVALFRAGDDEAFRAIHDRYHKRLFAYTRQMLPGRQDAEDALQDVFVRAYSGLRASDRELALRAWLFRVAHNRCIDELRKPLPPPAEVLELVQSPAHDPVAELDTRESLRRLVEDIRRLPEQQRSALLMRELAGMSYAELANSLGLTLGAVKSLLVRARVALAAAAEARDTACAEIREQLVEAHDRGVRPGAHARKHMRDCPGCKSFRRQLRGVSRRLAATVPALGPVGVLTKMIGVSGGGSAGGGAAVVSGSGTAASAGVALGVNHVATLIVAAVATAGGAVEIGRTILPPSHHARPPQAVARSHGHGHTPSSTAGTIIHMPAAVGQAPTAAAPDTPSLGLVRETGLIVPAARARPAGARTRHGHRRAAGRRRAKLIVPSTTATTTAPQTLASATTPSELCSASADGSGQTTSSSTTASPSPSSAGSPTTASSSTSSGSCAASASSGPAAEPGSGSTSTGDGSTSSAQPSTAGSGGGSSGASPTPAAS